MPRRNIPGTDESLGIIGLGNSSAFYNSDMALSRTLIEMLLERGGSYIDAQGVSRSTVAKIVSDLSAQSATFIGNYETNGSQGAAFEQDFRSVLAESQDKALDLALTADIAGFSADSGKFRRLKEQGVVRYIGVARHRKEYHQPMIDLINAGAVDFVQVNYSLLEPESEQRLLPLAADKGVAVLVNRPFINGRWFSLVRGKPLPDWASEFDCNSWAQFSLKYIVSHPAVHCVLTETAKPKHAADNLGGGMGRLPDEKTRQRMRQLIADLV